MKGISGYIVLPAALLLLLAFARQGNDLKASMTRGKALYTTYCQSCHGEQGQGIEGVFPPLAKSDYLMADRKRAIQIVLYGASGEMTVNGQTYNQPMAGIELKDEEVSDILNYVRNSFGNKGGSMEPSEVKSNRKSSAR